MQDQLAAEAEIVCRKARQEDLGSASELLNRYHVDRLGPEERRNGFISALFTPAQLREMAEDIGVFVAVSRGQVLACLCCYDSASPALPPPYRTMSAHFDAWLFRGRALSTWRCFAYGPVCIDVPARGRGVLRRLFTTMLPEVRQRYQAGTAFVAKDNPRSLAAHIDQLGMAPVGEFSHDGQAFVALAFTVD
ncbi:hypothetical protein C5L14_01780 [Labrys okinawensis]|uniref:GNAT family N-acetyltransferase n=1 Tax=Labrys okinawensis TaxID=346911 RepID=A0A2S9QJ18_9HYPH|nr:hypothetical protein [Labrys okinawensis]PRH89345.1 hypothetical protein C5L14_01780 [Labrys okinawensis]